MADKSKIAWTDATWNPVRGCTKVSAGCANCYAERFAERWRGIPGHPFEQGFDLRLVEEALSLPLYWRKPRRIFVNSMSDLFHPDVPDSFIQAVFTTMAHHKGRHHTYQILTKRPARMQALLSSWVRDGLTLREGLTGLALPNVWIGVSVENQTEARNRIPWLMETPAAVRFVSCEPLLGPVDLRRIEIVKEEPPYGPAVHLDALTGHLAGPDDMLPGKLDWVIAGGESGPRARPCDVKWIRSIVEQTKAAGVPCFVKQLGTQPRGDCRFRWTRDRDHHPAPEWLDEDGVLPSVSGRPAADLCHAFDDSWVPCKPKFRDRGGADPAEWPEDLRVQQMPVVRP